MGVGTLELVDFDVVEEGNLGAQGFFEKDLGEKKVVAVANTCIDLNRGIHCRVHTDKWARNRTTDRVMFICVDKIETRRQIWGAVKRDVALWIDGRMAAEVFRVLTHTSGDDPEKYGKTLFETGEAYQGSCTAKTTFYCASTVAGFMVAAYAKWLRGIPNDNVSVNLLTLELSVV